MDKKIENWLLEQGGPAIQLRMKNLQIGDYSKKEINKIVSELLDIGGVEILFHYMDGFKTPNRDNKTFEHLIHYYKDSCIDNFFPLLLDMGFKAGIPIFDEKMRYVREIFKYLISNEGNNCYNSSLMLHRFFFMAGYAFPEVIKSLENRLDFIHKVAKEKIFDIYQDGSTLPKRPPQWTNIEVVKDELNPFHKSVEKPLPSVYDIWALAYYSNICDDPEKLKKINDIIKYILDPEFQRIREGYGLLWVKDRRIFHSCGWSPTLPLYEIENHPVQTVPFSVISYVDFMSNFKIVHKSKWFKHCLSHFEQYKTKYGTYILPKEYLNNKYLDKKYIDKAFLHKTNMTLKRGEREMLKLEIISTMKMFEIYKRIL